MRVNRGHGGVSRDGFGRFSGECPGLAGFQRKRVMRGHSNVPRMSPSPLHIAVYDTFIGADDAIAIADNDPITFRALESLLGRDFTVLWTELSGRTAVIRCVEDRQIPDVLLLDMALSDAPGPRVCRCLRANLDTMPILATTSYLLEAFAERAAENRAQGIEGKADIGAMAGP